ncbi:flavin-containing monooxygenase [Aspergillus homomorphus CBS 101889]|uniref:Putative flavin-binding monooxygenase n=1 Tax=Aspergillus homomorphus (strain CBS 101889) TaxID=1450537 RepID=A0A395HL71_ASPHC|nr:putative flavin-binding monooxygenase [Aspergillus homomorphus CBS 101889]RAL07034.1 putative flavin-binding monooxygenase [Aspergillus homomorphus CBS 101889]
MIKSVESVAQEFLTPQQRCLKTPNPVKSKPVVVDKGTTPTPVEAATTQPRFCIEEHPGDQPRQIRVGVVGAGISGITAGILLPAKVPGINLTILEKNADVGGAWFENTYPGVRCDVPAHVYQSGFAPNTQWKEEFAQGTEIRQYWQDIARRYEVYKYLRLQRKVLRAEWQPNEAQWKVTIQDLRNDKIYSENFDIFITALGYFNTWRIPEFQDMDKFQGTIFHSSDWDHSVPLDGKRIALIGNGASGIQILPEIQPVAAQVDHYARSRTWIVHPPNVEGDWQRGLFTAEKLESFRDPQTYLQYRKEKEAEFFRGFATCFQNSPENDFLRQMWTASMLQRVENNTTLLNDLIPDFPPCCRRPTPGPGYLEALIKPNVELIRSGIERFARDGILAADGVERKAEIVICATGANSDLVPPFPIIGAAGLDLRAAWGADGGLYGFPYTYLGMATPGFPNALWLGGPHVVGPSGTVPNCMENQVTYIAKMIRKVRGQGIRTFVPAKKAADDFLEYCLAFFPRTVWTGNDDLTPGKANCRSWMNGGRPNGFVHGLFPGSASLANYARRDPRWEDWEYTYTNPSGNRFAYLGNGWTTREMQPDADLTPHLKQQDHIDLKSYLEGWWDV